MSITEKIDGYLYSGVKRWHTPGHKGTLCARDITEIGADGELFPAREVADAESRCARFFGSRYCRFLVCGSSMGIKAAIMSAGGNVLAVKNRHRCVDEGARLARVQVIDIETKLRDGLYDLPTAGDVENALKNNPSAKAVLIVSPDYYGRTAAADIARAVHSAGKILIADSAHGAHFAARPDLFGTGFSPHADFTVMSAHKTMHAYTQTAYLCINSEKLIEKTDDNLRLLGTTSPSYLFLEGLENAVENAVRRAGDYDALLGATQSLRKRVRTLDGGDFTRVAVDCGGYGKSGRRVYERLMELGHSAEMFDERRVVFIVTPDDTAEEIERLADSLEVALNER